MSGSSSKTDESGSVLRSSLERRWLRTVREVRRCRRGSSEDAVHDLRVAIRRLIATLDLAAVVLDDPDLGVVRRNLRKTLTALGALRDVQVQLLLLRPVVARHSFLGSLQTVLKVKERRFIMRLKRRLDDATPTPDAMIVRRAAAKLPAAIRLRGPAVIAAATLAFTRAALRKELADVARPATIHRLRIAFKKFRYAAEALQSLLPWMTKEMLRAMDAYQTRMGVIQDLEVLEESIRTFSLRSVPGRRGIPVTLAGELAARRRDLLRQFEGRADELYDYWRIPAGAGAAIPRSLLRAKHGTVSAPARHRGRARHARV